jgi:MFS transporter, LPLT family, lysophospholipid transporter
MNSERTYLGLPLFSVAMGSLLLAQFVSALADNAVLIIAIALVKSQGASNLAPYLQESFILPFILLAPFAGWISDQFPKARVMFFSNALKLIGVSVMAAGIHPAFAYLLIGIGAVFYSPSKYGLLSQMFEPRHLVRANSMLEGSTVVAILIGVLLGGWLTDRSMAYAFGAVMFCYAIAAVANLLIPRVSAEKRHTSMNLRMQIAEFRNSRRMLFSDSDARLSLLGTSIFWGSGVTLRLLLFSWVPVALHVNGNQTPANLMGCVSIGIILGAVIASIFISLETSKRSLVGGILLGPIIIALSPVHDITTASLLMAAIGLCGGLFVVPLNAVLQERGHLSVGTGHALAIQNFVENVAMLLFVGGYSIASSQGVSVHWSANGFGLIILISVLGLMLTRNWRLRPYLINGQSWQPTN